MNVHSDCRSEVESKGRVVLSEIFEYLGDITCNLKPHGRANLLVKDSDCCPKQRSALPHSITASCAFLCFSCTGLDGDLCPERLVI